MKKKNITKILFTGITGLIGRYFSESNPDPVNFRIIGTSRVFRPIGNFEHLFQYEPLPYQNIDAYRKLITYFKPDIIISCGGEGNIDLAEQNSESSKFTNLEFPGFLLKEAEKLNAKIIEFSSSMIYDGNQGPFDEGCIASPLNKYGMLKAELDNETRRFKGDWLILRPSSTYGWNFPFGRVNPLTQFLPLLQEGRDLEIVDDVYENPVYAEDIAKILWICIQKNICGEFNIGGGDAKVSRYSWLRTAAEIFGYNQDLIHPVPLSRFTSLAPRPKDIRLDNQKLIRSMNYIPLNVREGAIRMKTDKTRNHTFG